MTEIGYVYYMECTDRMYPVLKMKIKSIDNDNDKVLKTNTIYLFLKIGEIYYMECTNRMYLFLSYDDNEDDDNNDDEEEENEDDDEKDMEY